MTMAKLQPATCCCGHKGKSRSPEFYQCTFCYYKARAASNLETASRLERQARGLRAEAKRFKAKSEAFRAKHTDCKPRPRKPKPPEPEPLYHHEDFFHDCPDRKKGSVTAGSMHTTCKHCLGELQSRGDP